MYRFPTWQFLTVTFLCSALGYAWGVGDGIGRGRERERTEAAALKDEHDKIMRQIGVCKWSKIMADDIRCKQELP